MDNKLPGLNISIINATGALYKESITKIKTGKIMSEDFLVSKGLKQSFISPTLFKIFIEVTKKLKRSIPKHGNKS